MGARAQIRCSRDVGRWARNGGRGRGWSWPPCDVSAVVGGGLFGRQEHTRGWGCGHAAVAADDLVGPRGSCLRAAVSRHRGAGPGDTGQHDRRSHFWQPSWWCLRGLMRPLQALALGLPADPVSLSVLDARGVARNTYPHRQAEIQAFFVGQAKLACQLVNPDLLGQVARQSLSSSSCLVAAAPSLLSILACSEAIASSTPTSASLISARNARPKAPRRQAFWMHSGWANSGSPSLQSQAPRPKPLRSTTSRPF